MPNHQTLPPARLAVFLCLAVVLAACDVEWGGADLALERPPTPGDTAAAPQAAEDSLPDLPDPPMLYRVRSDTGGRTRISPVALIRNGGLRSIPLPADVPDRWWRRFDSTFLAASQELSLRRGGSRLGTVVLTARSEASGPRCPGTAAGQLLLPPETPAPATGFALSPGIGSPTFPLGSRNLQTTGRQRTFAPILAERLLREAGVERHYLAREADLRPAALGDSVPGFAATYLVADSLAPGAPAGRAVSLFFLARPHPSEGYVADWSVVERYESGEGKTVYRYVESLHLPSGRIDLLQRYGESRTRLAAAWAGDGGRRVRWSEHGRCTGEDQP